MTKEALTLLVHEMEYVLSCINEDKIPFDGDDFHEALRLGKEALSSPNGEAQPEQEPVATVTSESGNLDVSMSWWHEPALPVGTRLYTTPSQRKPLTDEQMTNIITTMCNTDDGTCDTRAMCRAIEASHGIKE